MPGCCEAAEKLRTKGVVDMQMTRRLIGTVIISCLASTAFGALFVSNAWSVEFKCEVENCALVGFQEASPNNLKLSIGSGLSITCTEAGIEAYSAAKTTTEHTMKPKTSNCTSSVGSATVNFNHCDRQATLVIIGFIHLKIHKTCSGESVEEYTTGGCTVKMGSQTPGGKVEVINKESGGKKLLTFSYALNEIAYSKSGLTCGFVTGEATYTGAETVKCFGGASRTESATTTFTYNNNGSQVNCEVV
jgi:hypothetical protein